jgi:protein-tyrosine phosphatase
MKNKAKNKKIIFICTGNTCRSPMAEIILKKKLKDASITGIRVSSAGLSATAGSPISINSAEALKNAGYKVGAFKSKQATPNMIKRAELVICMTKEHKRYLSGFERVYSMDEVTGIGDIMDPYGGNLQIYTETARQIERACEIIIRELIKVKGE